MAKPRSKSSATQSSSLLNDLAQDFLKSILEYDPNNGNFKWLKSLGPRSKIGSVAGSLNNENYLHIKINGKRYKAHRLVFLYMTGEWPKDQVDHINNIRYDNRWCNLREAVNTENTYNYKVKKNNKLGVKGVYFYRGKYRAQIQIEGQKIYLGEFNSLHEAKNAHDNFAIEKQKQFVNFTIGLSNGV